MGSAQKNSKYNFKNICDVYNITSSNTLHTSNQPIRATTATTASARSPATSTSNISSSERNRGGMSTNTNSTFRFLNEERQQESQHLFRLQQPALVQLFDTHEPHRAHPQPVLQAHFLQHPHHLNQPEQQYLEPFHLIPEYQQYPLQPQQPEHQQYANHRYGIPLIFGFNIGSWCTRSWG